jgi:adenosylhomocysteinase
VAHADELAPRVHDVPRALDEEVARLTLAALGVELDALTPDQQAYLTAWEQGT